MGNQQVKPRQSVVVGYAKRAASSSENSDDVGDLVLRHGQDGMQTMIDLEAHNYSAVSISASPRPCTIDLHAQDIVYVSPQIAFSVNLHTLELQRNLISTLPDTVATLHCLTWIDISHNQFKELPVCLTKLTTLLELKADYNQITSVPAEIGNLEKLLTLSLSHNDIVEMPMTIGNLEALATLNLSFNKIKALPSQIGRLKNLRHVLLESCPLYTKVTWNAEQLAIAAAAAQTAIATLPAHHQRALLSATISAPTMITRSSRNANALGASVNSRNNLTITLTPANNWSATSTDVSLPATAATSTPTSPRSPSATQSTGASAEVQQQVQTKTTTIAFPRVLSLKETAARVLVRRDVPVVESVPEDISAFLSTVQTCASCGGPYFCKPVQRLRFVVKGDESVPLLYKLCSSHWRNEAERIKSIFLPKPSTAPTPLDRFESERVVLHMSQEIKQNKTLMRRIRSAEETTLATALSTDDIGESAQTVTSAILSTTAPAAAATAAAAAATEDIGLSLLHSSGSSTSLTAPNQSATNLRISTMKSSIISSPASRLRTSVLIDSNTNTVATSVHKLNGQSSVDRLAKSIPYSL